jgi:hypothetical protein
MADSDKNTKVNVVIDVTGKDKLEAAYKDIAATGEAAKKSNILAGTEAGAGNAAAAAKEDGEAMKLLFGQINKLVPELGEALEAGFAGRLAPVILTVMAVHELIETLGQMDEALEQAQARSRETFAEVVKDAESASERIKKSTKSIDDFFDALNRKLGQKDVQNDFAAELQRIKETGDAAVKNGLADRDQADQFIDTKTQQVKVKRAEGLDLSVESLSKQLETLKAAGSGDETKKKEEELQALRRDQANLREAFKAGQLFRPESVAKNTIGVLADNTLKSPENEAKRTANFAMMEAEINRLITQREEGKTKLEEHVKLLEKTIERMATEAQGLKFEVNKGQVTTATEDFSRGRSIANNALKTGSINVNDGNYIVTLEQAITGHKVTLQQAIALIQAQSKSMDTASQVLETHQEQIIAVDAKLKQLQEQAKNFHNSRQG